MFSIIAIIMCLTIVSVAVLNYIGIVDFGIYGKVGARNGIEEYAMFYYEFDSSRWNDGDFNELQKVIICEWDEPVLDNKAMYKKYADIVQNTF